MLLIDLVIAGAVFAGVAILVGGLSGKRLDGWLAERRRRTQGQKNAELERRRQAEKCAACDRQIDPEIDLWEQDVWWHRDCWREHVSN